MCAVDCRPFRCRSLTGRARYEVLWEHLTVFLQLHVVRVASRGGLE